MAKIVDASINFDTDFRFCAMIHMIFIVFSGFADEWRVLEWIWQQMNEGKILLKSAAIKPTNGMFFSISCMIQ